LPPASINKQRKRTTTMIDETSDTPFPTSSGMGSSGTGSTGSMGSMGSMGSTSVSSTGIPASYDEQGRVRRVAQKAHETVDRLEQTIGSGSEKVMGWQQEYGEMARDQVRTSPLAALGIAFGVGIIFSKLFMR
jgi:ElaB/YqjD/DUF883 family membrane-anchored ribosome-binding protein